jgi:hypothetical protein
MILAIIGTLMIIGAPQAPLAQAPAREAAITGIPFQTDDNLDPITLVFTGYAPSWWVASNIADWSDSGYCSGPKTVNGHEYNYTLEHPDPGGLPCFGPRDHVRIWDMGYSSVFGQWSVASAHHEHTVCDPLCHHVIDGWDRAEIDARSAFAGGQATLSISNLILGNAGYYQGVYNDGNATMIRLGAPSAEYPVVFNENGLSNRTSWSVTMNGTTKTSEHPDIAFSEPNGTYSFAIGTPQGYSASSSSRKITVDGAGAHQTIQFTVPWSTSSAVVYSSNGNLMSIGFAGNATVAISSVQLITTTGNAGLSFTVTEIGPRGVLNVSLPRPAMSSGTSIVVFVDSVRSQDTTVRDETSGIYVYFPMLYGTHSVELQFDQPSTSYLEFVASGVLAVGILASLLIVFHRKRQRRVA